GFSGEDFEQALPGRLRDAEKQLKQKPIAGVFDCESQALQTHAATGGQEPVPPGIKRIRRQGILFSLRRPRKDLEQRSGVHPGIEGGVAKELELAIAISGKVADG